MISSELKEMCQMAHDNAKEQLYISNIMVNNIIHNGIMDSRTIEGVLDQILDATYMLGDETKDLYYQLLSYYKMIDLKASSDYEDCYLELFDEKEKKLVKRIHFNKEQ